MYTYITGLLAAALLCATAQGASAQVLNETFEAAGLPAGWQSRTASTDGGWNTGTAPALSSTWYSIPAPAAGSGLVATNDDGCGQSCDKSTDTLYSPVLNLVGQGSLFLQFSYYYKAGVLGSRAERAQALGWNGTGWDTLATLTGNDDAWQTWTGSLAAYSSLANFRLAFVYSDGGGYFFGLALDDVQVAAAPENSLAVQALVTPRFIAQGQDISLSFRIKNTGGNRVSSLRASYQLPDGSVRSSTLTGLNIQPLQSYTLTHPQSYKDSIMGLKYLKFWVSLPNNQPDPDASDDTLAFGLSPYWQQASTQVLLETLAGTECRFCPEGDEVLDRIRTDQTYVAAVQLHTTGPFALADAYLQPLLTTYGLTNMPSGLAGRSLYAPTATRTLNRGYWEPATQALADAVPPATLTIEKAELIPGERYQLSVGALFTAADDRTYSLLAYVTEDSLVAPQLNGLNNTPGSTWYQQGDTLHTYMHHRVVRAIAGGTQGLTVFPAPQDTGQYHYEFAPTDLPAGANIDRMKVVAVLLNNTVSPPEVVAVATDLLNGNLTAADAPATPLQATLYPNPATTGQEVRLLASGTGTETIHLRDLAGKTLLTAKPHWLPQPGGRWSASIPLAGLAPGLYLVQVAGEGRQHTTRLLVR